MSSAVLSRCKIKLQNGPSWYQICGKMMNRTNLTRTFPKYHQTRLHAGGARVYKVFSLPYNLYLHQFSAPVGIRFQKGQGPSYAGTRTSSSGEVGSEWVSKPMSHGNVILVCFAYLRMYLPTLWSLDRLYNRIILFLITCL